MTRKLNVGRVYNMIRFIVVILAILPIVYGSNSVRRLIKYNNGGGFNYEEAKKIGYSEQEITNFINTKKQEEKDKVYLGFIIGFGIPIVFFGSKATIDYVMPEVKDIEERNK